MRDRAQVGFTGAGIAAGSLAAKMMSAAAIANGGGVPSAGQRHGAALSCHPRTLLKLALGTSLGSGFTAGGIAAGSLAAKLMSIAALANGGGVVTGSLVAILQSIGK
uniref:Uncharacterized protein n=1 Tax=Pelusios castaneus TaxID=367368 RepID=A0A8C8RAE6_9SAUR